MDAKVDVLNDIIIVLTDVIRDTCLTKDSDIIVVNGD